METASCFQNKMADDDKKDDNLRQFVVDACKAQALEVG